MKYEVQSNFSGTVILVIACRQKTSAPSFQLLYLKFSLCLHHYMHLIYIFMLAITNLSIIQSTAQVSQLRVLYHP